MPTGVLVVMVSAESGTQPGAHSRVPGRGPAPRAERSLEPSDDLLPRPDELAPVAGELSVEFRVPRIDEEGLPEGGRRQSADAGRAPAPARGRAACSGLTSSSTGCV